MKRLVFLLFLSSTILFAEGKVEVFGTSTFHDWTMVSNAVNVEMQRDQDKITSLNAFMVIGTLKSDSESMDENAYETLKMDPKDAIYFELIEHKEDGSFDGVFKVGEREKKVNIFPDSIENGIIKGTIETKMTSFGLEPPSFLFGAMSTGDDILIKYEISE